MMLSFLSLRPLQFQKHSARGWQNLSRLMCLIYLVVKPSLVIICRHCRSIETMVRALLQGYLLLIVKEIALCVCMSDPGLINNLDFQLFTLSDQYHVFGSLNAKFGIQRCLGFGRPGQISVLYCLILRIYLLSLCSFLLARA